MFFLSFVNFAQVNVILPSRIFFISERLLKINNLHTDLSDGILLCNLIEVISGEHPVICCDGVQHVLVFLVTLFQAKHLLGGIKHQK